jgi:hypothetical protein
MLLPALFALLGTAPDVKAASVAVYAGAEGQRVEVVRLSPLEARLAVVRISGSGSEHDGLALPCEMRSTFRGIECITRYRGNEWTLLMLTDDEGVNARLPDRRFDVNRDVGASRAARPAEVLAAAKEQSQSGRLAAFQSSVSADLSAAVDKLVSAVVKARARRCGKAVEFVIESGTFTEDPHYDPYSACKPLLNKVEGSCEWPKAATRVRCRAGRRFDLRAEGDELVFTVIPSQPLGAAHFLSER